MGMFDYYRPSTEKRCPSCQGLLRDWQGKDGPNGLFVWAEGLGAPVNQLVDDECQVPIAERQRLVLPAKFIIYSYDCPTHRPVEAVCRTVEGVWRSTEIQSK